MPVYKALFGALWNAKRMEYVLSNLRKQQISSAKLFKNINGNEFVSKNKRFDLIFFLELKPVMHVLHICTAEMIHFLHQTQYYFLFEVLECSWAEMLNRVNQAVSLDDIITAHNTFLKSVQNGILLDSASNVLYEYFNMTNCF